MDLLVVPFSFKQTHRLRENIISSVCGDVICRGLKILTMEAEACFLSIHCKLVFLVFLGEWGAYESLWLAASFNCWQDEWFRYCRVFQYLLRLKRTQMELEKSWASLMHQDHADFSKNRNDRFDGSISPQKRQRFRQMWRVREHMAFLIRNLQFYIQVRFNTFYWLQCHALEISLIIRK